MQKHALAFYSGKGPALAEMLESHQLQSVDTALRMRIEKLAQERRWRIPENVPSFGELDFESDPGLIVLWDELHELRKRVQRLEKIPIEIKTLAKAMERFADVLSILTQRIDELEERKGDSVLPVKGRHSVAGKPHG